MSNSSGWLTALALVRCERCPRQVVRGEAYRRMRHGQTLCIACARKYLLEDPPDRIAAGAAAAPKRLDNWTQAASINIRPVARAVVATARANGRRPVDLEHNRPTPPPQLDRLRLAAGERD